MDINVTITHELSPSAFQLLKQLVERTVVASDNSFMVTKPDGTPVPIVSEPTVSVSLPIGGDPLPKPKRTRKPKNETQSPPAEPKQQVATPVPPTPLPAAPASPPAPVAGGVQAAKPTSTPAPGPVLTLDDVARTVSALLPRIGMDTLRDVLAQFKLKHVVKLTPEQFSPFLTALQEAAKTVGAQPTKAAQ